MDFVIDIKDFNTKNSEEIGDIICDFDFIKEKSIHVDQFPIANIIHIVDMKANSEGKWSPRNINPEYNEHHQSWVYFITINGYILKIGESSVNLLLIGKGTTSKGRINKYFGYTDNKSELWVRSQLNEHMQADVHTIAFHAVAIPESTSTVQVGEYTSQPFKANAQVEKQAIKTFIKLVGRLPLLNRSIK